MSAADWERDRAAGAAAYDRREPWSSKKPEGWRAGWIQRQATAGAERKAIERALERETREMARGPGELRKPTT